MKHTLQYKHDFPGKALTSVEASPASRAGAVVTELLSPFIQARTVSALAQFQCTTVPLSWYYER